MGAAPIPKSATESRIKENIEIFDFSFSESEMKDLISVGSGERVIPFDAYVFYTMSFIDKYLRIFFSQIQKCKTLPI